MLLAKRYARAAFELASTSGDIDGWRRELQLLEQKFQEASLAQLIQDRSLSSERRRAAALELQVKGIRPQVLNLGRMVIEGGNVNLKEIISEFNHLADQAQNKLRVSVTTVFELAKAERTRLAENLSRILKKEVQLELQQDASILGGVVLRIGDRLIDASLRGRLRQLRQKLT